MPYHPPVGLFPIGVCPRYSNASLEAATVLRGHASSISAAHASGAGAYTGDWGGHVCMWDVACLGADADRGVSSQVCIFSGAFRSGGRGRGGSMGTLLVLCLAYSEFML